MQVIYEWNFLKHFKTLEKLPQRKFKERNNFSREIFPPGKRNEQSSRNVHYCRSKQKGLVNLLPFLFSSCNALREVSMRKSWKFILIERRRWKELFPQKLKIFRIQSLLCCCRTFSFDFLIFRFSFIDNLYNRHSLLPPEADEIINFSVSDWFPFHVAFPVTVDFSLWAFVVH